MNFQKIKVHEAYGAVGALLIYNNVERQTSICLLDDEAKKIPSVFISKQYGSS